MPRKIKDTVEYLVVDESNKISVFARVTAQTIKAPSRQRIYVGITEVKEHLDSKGIKYGKVLVNPGYITADSKSYSEFVFEKEPEIQDEEQEVLVPANHGLGGLVPKKNKKMTKGEYE
jgi:hypothetical protein